MQKNHLFALLVLGGILLLVNSAAATAPRPPRPTPIILPGPIAAPQPIVSQS